MTDEDIKEATVWSQKFRENFHDGVNEVDELNYADNNLKVLENIAQLYLSIAGKMPEEKTGKDENFSFLYQQHLPLAIEVYNQARQECILAMMKALPSVEDIVDIMLRFRPLTGCFSEETFEEWKKFFTTLAKAIHARLEGK